MTLPPSDNVVEFTGVSMIDVPVQRILDKAANANLGSCIVIGMTNDDEFWFASSVADGGDANWLLDIAKKRLLEAGGA